MKSPERQTVGQSRIPQPGAPAQGTVDGSGLSPTGQDADAPHGHPAGGRVPQRRTLALLALGALGVVYGDIGTSPLYSLKECFKGPHGVAPTPENVLGVLSLVFWALSFVVTFKYLTCVMRADNRGQGGILALMALVSRQETTHRGRHTLMILGLFGAALLYGDGVITPAISVLGAVEGLAVAAPGLDAWVAPISVAILIALFLFQKRGTAIVGEVFGPVMLVWFSSIALVGLRGILRDPSVLWAVSPHHAVRFFLHHRLHGFLVLGAVVLVITGAEALYADLGHFGRTPIRVAWLGVAMPALLLNYFGQGAVLLLDPTAAPNPFYLAVPEWALYPMIGIATAAAIVASQALISGAFSLTSQAVQLGYSPRVTIRHTSSTEYGQIYIPEVNAALGAACVALVLGFRSSSALAAAYGVAVTGTMAITTLLFHRVMRDLSFFCANLVKIEAGGWFPVAAAGVAFALMSTWKSGCEALAGQLVETGPPLGPFIAELERKKPVRVKGTAVFMTSNPARVPPVLLHHLKHNKVLHERVILVSVTTETLPAVPDAQRASARELGAGIWQVISRYGFMEIPNVPALLRSVSPSIPGPKLEIASMETSYYLGRETLLPTGPSRMASWRKKLFIAMARNAGNASAFFGLPPNRVVEMGAQIQL